MGNKSKIFNLSAISIIACDCLQAVVCIFVDLFLISKILNNPTTTVTENIIRIGLFYVIYYCILTGCYAFTGYGLKKINKSIFVTIGSILLTVVIILVNVLQKDLFTFMPLLAVVYGFGFGFFSGGFNGLTAETISSKHQVRFFAVKRIMFQATYIIFPISLGAIADLNFSVVAAILLVICVALVVFSFLIRPKQSYHETFNLNSFRKYMWENRKQTKPLWLVYITCFFRGASYDCFTTLITILVMRSFESNTSLGLFQSIFTACSLVTMFVYLKYYRKKRSKQFILPTIILVTCSIVGILCATNKVTIVIFYAVYTILNVILMSIYDSRRAGVVRVLSLHSHILESNALSEFFLGVGRVLGSLFILLAGVFDGMAGANSTLFLKVALGLVCVMYVMYGVCIMWLEKSLIKQDEDFRKAHISEVIEKTED